jgi:hypothetical protein
VENDGFGGALSNILVIVGFAAFVYTVRYVLLTTSGSGGEI